MVQPLSQWKVHNWGHKFKRNCFLFHWQPFKGKFTANCSVPIWAKVLNLQHFWLWHGLVLPLYHVHAELINILLSSNFMITFWIYNPNSGCGLAFLTIYLFVFLFSLWVFICLFVCLSEKVYNLQHFWPRFSNICSQLWYFKGPSNEAQ